MSVTEEEEGGVSEVQAHIEDGGGVKVTVVNKSLF